MKRKKQWFAVILAVMLAVGQGIISAAPQESTTETASAKAEVETIQDVKTEAAQTEESMEPALASASEVKQETAQKEKRQEEKELPEIGGGYFQKEEISSCKG